MAAAPGEETAVAVVGAGPAGLAAAIRLAEGGAEVTLLDEGARPGGQIYRQPPAAFTVSAPAPGGDPARGRRLLERLEAVGERLRYRPGTAVWGVFDRGRTLALLEDGGRCTTLRAGTVVIASGAYERVVPFPGWTLPGVLTAGAVQVQLKSQRMLPGRRVLVAGSGPLPLVVATQLVAAGAQVPAVLEAGAVHALGWRLPALLLEPGLLREGLRYRRTLRRAGARCHERHAVVAARGAGRVEAVTVARLDRAGRPVRGSEHSIAVDAVAVGFGFVPNVELSLLAGAAHRHDTAQGGWVPVLDGWQQTTVPGVYVAGDGGGISGAVAAEAEGRLAALGILQASGQMAASAATAEARPLRRRLARLRAFQRTLARMSWPRPGWSDLIAPDTVVCRCEEVTRAEIDACLAEGQRRLDTLKRFTRAGMGFCQGRVCGPTLALLAGRWPDGDPARAGWLGVRPPLRPVPLGAFAPEAERGAESGGEGA